MSRPKPHRLSSGPRAGQCRDCGGYDAFTAPQTCCRCALERYDELGYQVVLDPKARLERYAEEMWRQVALQIFTGSVRSDRFYVFVGHNDGGPLVLPPEDEAAQGLDVWAMPGAHTAHATAKYLLEQRYPQAWVVTTVGCWNVARPSRGAA